MPSRRRVQLSRVALLIGLVALSVAVRGMARPPSGDVAARPAPEIHAETWVNSEPIAPASLRGRVVLVEFWTFGCWNCQNVEPSVKAWHERYADEGLVVLAVHTPESESERRVDRVRAYARERGLEYAIPIDNDRAIWRSFENRYWPAFYLIDRSGRIRHVRIGEGGTERTEAAIRRLLAEEAPAEVRG